MFKKRYMTLICTFMMFGCTQSKTTIDYVTYHIWDASSQKIEIVQNNGFVPPQTERIIRYTYTKAMLSNESIQALEQTIATGGGDTSDFYCMQDGTSYKVNITDHNNTISYLSSNQYCNKTADKKYLSTQKVKDLINLLAQ